MGKRKQESTFFTLEKLDWPTVLVSAAMTSNDMPDSEDRFMFSFRIFAFYVTVSLELVVVSAKLGEGGAVLLQQGDGRAVQPPALQTVLTFYKQF